MIIQCEKCQARFRLDDSRVTDKGVKVRCAKCKNVFSVRKEEPVAESFEHGTVLSDFTSAIDVRETPPAMPAEKHAVAESTSDFSFGSEALEETALPGTSVDFSPFETESVETTAISFDTDELHIDDTERAQETSVEPASMGGEVDFSSFDFGESGLEPDSSLSVDNFIDKTTEPVPAVPRKESLQGLDFSDDDMFGAVVKPTVPETTSETISFDFGDDSFAESMDMSGTDATSKGGTLFSLDTPADAPFNLGEIDFGDELTSVAVQQVNPDDLKPSQKNLFAPLAEAQTNSSDDDLKRSITGEASAEEQQDLPPLSITSRRKQSPVFRILIAVIAVLVISALGYFGYSSISTQKEVATAENGKIAVKDLKAAFVENDNVGELLVISGNVVNEYSKPRAALQIMVTVLDAAGKSIATKTAYGGNPLAVEQLKSLPLDKIESAMANQFGDSLANIEVAPGKAIPFDIVLANLPEGARDFTVQSAGSTVATGKQQ